MAIYTEKMAQQLNTPMALVRGISVAIDIDLMNGWILLI
jgi:hypothetical protein